MNINSAGCNSDGPTTKCSVPSGSSLTVNFAITALPTQGSYSAYDLEITYPTATLNYVASSLVQTGAGVWPNCVFAVGDGPFIPGDAKTGCTIGVPPAANSTYLGTLAHLDFVCKDAKGNASSGSATLTLVNANGHTDIVNGAGTAVSEPTSESITINCLAPTDTPTLTPTVTNTPTNTPTRTSTPTRTPTFTKTPTNTSTPTNTFTPTPTRTPTDTPTFTNTPTITNTPVPASATATRMSTQTPTITNTATITPTPTDTRTPTPTITPGGPTLTPTQTPTPASLIPTSTLTATPTPTSPGPTDTPTATSVTPTATITPTPSRTDAIPTATPTPTRTPTPTPVELIGDANKDGLVNVIDAQLVLQYDAGIISTINQNADANRDGRINVIDAQLILQLAAGLINHLPPFL